MIFKFRGHLRLVAFSLFIMVNLLTAEVAKEVHAGDDWFPHSIIAIEEGVSREVIDVNGSDPKIINQQGKKRTVSQTSQSDVIRTVDFQEGYVQISVQHNESSNWTSVTDGGVKLHNLGDGYRGGSVKIEFVADRDIEDCYVVLIIPKILLPGEVDYNLIFKSLGTLKAGVKKKASIYIGMRLGVIPAVFSHGKEIHTNLSPKVDAFARLLRTSKEGNRTAQCIRKVYPHMKTETDDLPVEISVVFSVDTAGNVTSVLVKTELPPATSRTLNDAFKQWRFLPEIEKGKAIPAVVTMVIPLRAEMSRTKATIK